MSASLRIAIAVTHLLGVGHLARAAALARAMEARGHHVTLISGGEPAPLIARLLKEARGPGRIDVAQLPPLHVVGTAFSDLREHDGQPLRAETAAARIGQAVAALRACAPHALITELYPFGRRALASEFNALIAAARALPEPPLILSSVRDILARPSKQAKIDAAHDLLRRLYDGVLVHGDPAAAPLEASWPLAPDLMSRVRYTGYVDDASQRQPPPAAHREGVVVSGGGSAAGLPLLRAALAAAALDGKRQWRLLLGHKIPETEFAALATATPANAIVERARPDFRALLAGCAVSVSQFGYNTALDILATRAPAVVVPFADGGETEQSERAALFAARGLVEALPQAELTPQRLLDAVNAAAASPSRPACDAAIAVDGARRSAIIVEELVSRRPGAPARIQTHRDSLAPVAETLAKLAETGRVIDIWWRDDDVIAPTASLDRLLALARAHGAPLALAAIPAEATPELAARLVGEDGVVLLPHGLSHANLAPDGAKKGELSHGEAADIAARAGEGLRRLRQLAPGLLRPVLTPPWNRIKADALPLLPAHGFIAVSTFKERNAVEAAPGLVQLNTHIDPINWRGDRSLVDPDALARDLVAAIERRLDADAAAWRGPIGLLTHHLVHDAAIDAWTADFASLVASSPAARFVDVDLALRSD